ncbi:hypothetical protein QJQ45_003058 [Haematococcus lacustris]|nr:hypothetical protein QJQ45_003058 [Haematococcus lacustris]
MAVLLETSKGDIVIDLFVDDCPIASKNFIKLCKLKYYNNCLFYSVQRNFLVQTGDPTGSGKGGSSIYGLMYGDQARFFEDEKRPHLKHKIKGMVGMASPLPNTNGSQFYITTGEEVTSLDNKHTVFGKVAEGLDILDKINEAFCDEAGRPYQNIRIRHTIILEDPFDDPPELEALLPEGSPEPQFEQVSLIGDRLEDDWVPLEDTRDLEQIEEETRKAEAHNRAVVLEMIGDLPEADAKPPSNVLFICKLNPVTTEEDLDIIFSRFGVVTDCDIIRDYKTGDSLCYGFIGFDSEASCEEAYFKMNNVLIDDRRIKVDFSQSVAHLWKQFKKWVQCRVDGDTTIDTLKAILEAETGISSHEQALIVNNRALRDSYVKEHLVQGRDTAQSSGLKDGDVIQMMPQPAPGQGRQGLSHAQQAQAPRSAAPQQQPAAAPSALLPDGSAASPAGFITAIKQDTATLAALSVNMPELARAIREDNHALLQEQLRAIHKRRVEHEAALAREMELLEADPLDVDAQRRIEDLIRQKNVDENYSSAMEHSPEVRALAAGLGGGSGKQGVFQDSGVVQQVFTQVHMLYISMEVNNVPVKAFVDSGAQMTIMTHDFAERCGLLRLMDTRFQGVARGVGSSKILGKVHQAQAKVGGHFLTVAITILEQKSGPPFILGLDQLKKHACCINLKTNKLQFTAAEVEVPFLSEAEIPKEETFEGSLPETVDAATSARMSCEGLEALPLVGNEYQQRYKLVDDRLPKGRQRLHRATEYRRGIDGRARNTAQALVVYTDYQPYKALSCWF